MNKKGFTLVEAVVAMFLVAVIVGGVFTALMAARRAVVESTGKEDMVYFSTSVIDHLKTNISATLANGAGAGPCNISSPLSSVGGAKDLTCLSTTAFDCSSASASYTVTDLAAITDPYPTPSGTPAQSFTLKRVFVNVNCQRNNL